MRRLFFLFLIFIGLSGKAQDVHFSMYDMAPLFLNPAETGEFDGDWRAVANFRQQWKAIGQPFQSLGASYDQKIYGLPGDFRVGLLVLNDQSGLIDLNQNRFYLSLAYNKDFKLWSVQGGVQAGMVIKDYNLTGTTFPEQYNDNIGQFDPSLALSETGLSNQTSYFDLNAGVGATRRLRTGEIRAGLSFLHLNNPDVSFFENEDRLPLRTNAYMRWLHNFENDLFVKPSLLVSTSNKAQEIIAGAEVGTYISNSPNGVKEISVGLSLRNGFDRNGDAFIGRVGFAIKDFRFGLAYDINYSSLNEATNNRGAFEVSLIYISPSTALKRITIPCDRY